MRVLPFVYLGFAFVLFRFGTAAEPKENRSKTEVYKVEHTCVLPSGYLASASVLIRVCCDSEPGQKRGNTEVDKR